MALSVCLFVYAGLSLFIISGPYLYVVVCVLYAYNLTALEKKISIYHALSIEHDYIRIIKVSVFQEMGSSTVVRHERQVCSTVNPRVEGSTPVRGNFFAEFFSLIQFWQI